MSIPNSLARKRFQRRHKGHRPQDCAQDGKGSQEHKRRRDNAYNAWLEAKAQGALEAARTYAQESTRVDKAIVSSAKQLLDLMGIAQLTSTGKELGKLDNPGF